MIADKPQGRSALNRFSRSAHAVLLAFASIGLVACGDSPVESSAEDVRGLPPTIVVQSPVGSLSVGVPLGWKAVVSDPDAGDVVAVKWVFTDSAGVVVASSSGLEVSQTFMARGTYSVVATATDMAGLTAEWVGVASVLNVAPSLTVEGPSGPFGPGVEYTWTAAVDDLNLGEGDSVSVRWSFSDGKASEDGLAATRVFTDTGRYVVRALATDAAGLTAEWADTISVNNEAPRLEVLAPTGPFEIGQVLSWRATVVDPNLPDGDSVTVVWSFSDGKGGASGLAVERSFDKAGEYTVSAVAIDRGGQSATWASTIAVGVANRAPAIAVKAPAHPRMIGQPLIWVATVTDPDAGDSLSVSWKFSGGLPGASGLTAAQTIAKSGTYTVTATVTDRAGLQATWTETFTTANQPPVAVLSKPHGSVVVGVLATFEASGSSDPEGRPLSYKWLVDDVVLPGETGSSLAIMPTSSGIFTFGVIVTDPAGASDSAYVTVNVITPDDLLNQAPVARLTVPSGPYWYSKNYSFNALTSSDPDGDALSYQWLLNGTPVAAYGTNADYVFHQEIPGTYSIGVIVSDPVGASDTAYVSLSVLGNQAPNFIGGISGPTNPDVGVPVEYSVRVSDLDGNIRGVAFSAGLYQEDSKFSLPAGADTVVKFTVTFTTTARTDISFKVIDDGGLEADLFLSVTPVRSVGARSGRWAPERAQGSKATH